MTREVIVEADGGSRGNPGPAGCGAVVRDAGSGTVLAERAVPLGTATNNYAEYTGLITGLQAATDLDAEVVDVRMDSKLVVEQMSGRWKIKNATLQPLAAEAKRIAAGFRHVGYQWIPRERNTTADHLANVAMDDQAGVESSATTDTTGATTDTTGATTDTTMTTPAGRDSEEVRPTRWMGAAGEPTRLVLLRHGQTALSVQRRYSGHGDVPLNEVGREQAAAAAKRLADSPELTGATQPVPVLSSPLTRADSTARAVAEACGSTVQTRHGLIETDFGQWEGLSFTEAAERDPELHGSWLGDSAVAPPGGESFEAVYGRTRQLCDDVLKEFTGRTVVLVSHVTPIKSLLRMALDAGPSLLYRLHLDLAALSIIEFYPDGNATARLVNDSCHLRGQ